MVLTRPEWHLEQNEVYPNAMAGFRRDQTSIDNVFELVTPVAHQKSMKRITVVMFLDVKGAYDNVAHQEILDALTYVGIGGRALHWIHGYLEDRSFFVLAEEGMASHHLTSKGVPQGGVLSPTLFNTALLGLV